MRRLYSARPSGRRLIVSPGQTNVLVIPRGRRAVERSIKTAIEPDWDRNAPITEFSDQFKTVMRIKGWLR